MQLTVEQLALAAMLLAAVTSATPMAKQESKEEPTKDMFSVKQVRTKLGHGRKYGPAGLRHAYDKYNMGRDLVTKGKGKKGKGGKQKTVKQKSTDSKADSSAAGGVGIVAATPSEPTDLEYVSTVTIGGQEVHVNFDTGSSDL